jgi:hypothetical protein
MAAQPQQEAPIIMSERLSWAQGVERLRSINRGRLYALEGVELVFEAPNRGEAKDYLIAWLEGAHARHPGPIQVRLAFPISMMAAARFSAGGPLHMRHIHPDRLWALGGVTLVFEAADEARARNYAEAWLKQAHLSHPSPAEVRLNAKGLDAIRKFDLDCAPLGGIVLTAADPVQI